MLIAPSWGGMLNGLLTLRGAWDKVREDPILKFMVVAITAYGMATFEGPMLSVKSINALSHFTDWTIAHVHVGALGWNGFLTAGILYWLLPRMYNTSLFSRKLANLHFWIGFLGIIIYAAPMYWAGITQSLMWKQFTPDGFLVYTNFIETVIQIVPFYMIRSIGGTLFFVGILIMIYNLYKTIKQGKLIEQEEAQAAPLAKKFIPHGNNKIHRWLERQPVPFLVLTLIVIVIGGALEIIPMYVIKSNVPTIPSVKPYTPLELHGRDIYIREGCYTCHSQLVRPFRSETVRYGEYSKVGEFVYDHPFQWGSRRTGPDLARAGVMGGPMYKNAAWHYNHFIDPQKMNEQSIMPKYPWLASKEIDTDIIPAKIRAMQTLGVPYPEGYDQQAVGDLLQQAQTISNDLKVSGIELAPTKQMIAMIAYLNKLGRDIVPAPAPVDTTKTAALKEVTLLTSPEDLAAAKAIFTTVCAVCHGPEGKGIPPAFPNLTDDVWIKGNSPAQVYHSIAEGNIAKGMVPYKTQYSDKQITQLTSYVLTVLNKK
jgi:cytochrome c oxidase cbb3-type subunit I/II